MITYSIEQSFCNDPTYDWFPGEMKPSGRFNSYPNGFYLQVYDSSKLSWVRLMKEDPQIMLNHLHIDARGDKNDKWYICWPDGSLFHGPYKTAAAAKRELTIMRKK